jgi:predicted DNA-binding protein (UPF0251 family)
MKPNAVIKKVSVTTEELRNLKCLKIKQLAAPNTMPISMETTPKEMNSARILKGVAAVN